MSIDPNVRARAFAYFRAYNAAHRQARQHQGPLTMKCRDVLRALLWLTGRRTSVSYEAIAAEAHCSMDTVWRALTRLRSSGLLSWSNRYAWSDRHRKVVRTTNAFRWLWPEMPKPENQNVILTRVIQKGAAQLDDVLEASINRFLALKRTP